MISIKKILVPTDFSDASNKAVSKASEIAEFFNAEIVLLHVKPNDTSFIEQYLTEELIQELNEKIDEDIQKNFEKQINESAKQGVKITTAIKEGVPYQQIIKAEEDYNVDLVIIAPHNKTFFKDVFLGSTTEKVIKRSKKSVLLVRE